MGFGIDQLRSKALLALEEAVQETRYGKVRQTVALRFALAYLWTTSSGHRAPFDDFWKALVDTEHFWRFGRADAALGSIYRVLHLKRDHDLTMRMWKRAQDRISPRDSNGMLINPPERRS